MLLHAQSGFTATLTTEHLTACLTTGLQRVSRQEYCSSLAASRSGYTVRLCWSHLESPCITYLSYQHSSLADCCLIWQINFQLVCSALAGRCSHFASVLSVGQLKESVSQYGSLYHIGYNTVYPYTGARSAESDTDYYPNVVRCLAARMLEDLYTLSTYYAIKR